MITSRVTGAKNVRAISKDHCGGRMATIIPEPATVARVRLRTQRMDRVKISDSASHSILWPLLFGVLVADRLSILGRLLAAPVSSLVRPRDQHG